MKAYLCTIGEKTTAVCKAQLEYYGFDVVMLDEMEPWYDKYRRFIDMASASGESCIRVDGDVIVNENVKIAFGLPEKGFLMAQFTIFDFYQNNICLGQPVYYSIHALHHIRKHFKGINPLRPEASAWRLPDINEGTYNIPEVVGMHGFFQDKETMERALKNKQVRGQMHRYDFNLVAKLLKL